MFTLSTHLHFSLIRFFIDIIVNIKTFPNGKFCFLLFYFYRKRYSSNPHSGNLVNAKIGMVDLIDNLFGQQSIKNFDRKIKM